jgi:glutathione S-transferase
MEPSCHRRGVDNVSPEAAPFGGIIVRGRVGPSMPEERTFFHLPMSHYCVSADRMLALKGLHPRLVLVPYHDKRELIAATGQDYVPALKWDGRVVTWKEIPEFLESVQPNPSLFPPRQRGLALAIQSWGHEVVEERVWRAVVTHLPAILQDDHERWVFEEMQIRARGPWHVLEARREEFEEDLDRYLGLVDAMVTDSPYLLNAPSLADCAVYGGLSPLFTAGKSVPRKFPHLAEWVERVRGFGPGAAQTAPAARAARRTAK